MFFSIVENSGNNRSVSVGDKAISAMLAFRKKLPHCSKAIPAERKQHKAIVTKQRTVLNKHGLVELILTKDKEYVVTKQYVGGKMGVTSGDVW